MCGRIIQAGGPVRYAIVEGIDVADARVSNIPRRYNGAPSQELLVIRENHRSGERSLDLLKWGFVPRFTEEAKPKLRPINAKAETVATSPFFSDSFRQRRCIVPVDGFFEWRAENGGKQPYAVGMKDGSPFALAGLWDNWRDPSSNEWARTFAVITVPANALMARIHDRMPAILRPEDYERWLGPDADPGDVLRSFPAEPMTMWPVSRRVNSPRDDDAGLIEPIVLHETA